MRYSIGAMEMRNTPPASPAPSDADGLTVDQGKYRHVKVAELPPPAVARLVVYSVSRRWVTWSVQRCAGKAGQQPRGKAGTRSWSGGVQTLRLDSRGDAGWDAATQVMLEQALKALEAEQDHTAALKRARGPPPPPA